MGISSKKKTTTSTTTPTVPDFIQTPYKSYMGSVGNLMTTPQTQGPTNQQQAAFGFMGSTGTNRLNDWSNVNPILRGTKQYMNPYESAVIDNSLRDLERSRKMAINAGQADAIAASAFGGSRHGVADSLTNREFADSAGNLASNLRYQGYTNAQNAAMQDAQFRANAAGAAAGSQRADVGLMGTLGEQNRQLQALQNPNSPEYLQMISQLLAGGNPGLFTGQTTTEKTKSSGGLGGVLGGLGTLAMGLGTGGLGLTAGGLFGGLGGAASGFVPGWASGSFK